MKILIIKTSSLGDIIHAFPVLQYLKSRHPQAQIDWVVEQPFVELVQAHPSLHQAWSVNTKKWRKGFWKKDVWQDIRYFVQQIRQQTYDVAIDLQGNTKSGLILAFVKSAKKIGFGSKSVPEWPNLLFTNQRYNPPPRQNIREDYLFLAQSILGDFKAERKGVQLKIEPSWQVKLEAILAHEQIQNGMQIMVCPGSNWTNKQLPKETLKAFLQQILDKCSGRFLFVWGSPAEKDMGEYLAAHFPDHSLIVDRLPLPALQNLMARMDAVIAMDSLPLHLAGTTPTPTYGIFGASSSHKYKPLGGNHGAFQGSCPFNQSFEKRCPLLRTCSTGNCIKDIDAARLFQSFETWWKNRVL
ncbi:lipopolysaccharide heptosyltransferase I [Candidatus Protochlamydia phocaeensis]|uniref:lipopolysaccharide heptosyltransferase I n=1 Tax=Candidatus Protochlamydia phocaeensis TaxID=1414722 RepID=UPI000839761C|nr:lipopolysaccharide heptosyltransferase I [Candidatus Protochlamydia phocaeensis]